MNAVIACGGTGGHLFPGIAVAEVLRDRGHDVMLLISEKEIDALALSGHSNFRVEKLPTVGLPSPIGPAGPIPRPAPGLNSTWPLSAFSSMPAPVHRGATAIPITITWCAPTLLKTTS